MDLALLGGVLWRSRVLVIVGLLLACVAAVLSMAKLTIVGGKPQLVYRTQVLYQSNVQLHVTQPGFPDGRSVFNTSPTTLPSGRTELPKFADPDRFVGLAVIYSQLIMGNDERARVFGVRRPPRNEAILAAPMPAPGGTGQFLPIIQITGIAPSPLDAMRLADRAAQSFSDYLSQRQNQTHVADAERVTLDRIAGPLAPSVYLPRKKLRSIAVFLLLAMLTIAAAFVRENLRVKRSDREEARARAVDLPVASQAERSASVQHGSALARER